MTRARSYSISCFRRQIAWSVSGMDIHAAVALEFALVAPVFMLFLFAILGAGMVGFDQHVLDDATRDAVRQIQIDAPAAASNAAFIAALCSEFGVVAPDCTANITYNVQATTQSAGFASMTPVALPSSGKFANGFFASGAPFGAGVNVLVQVAYPLPYSIPFLGKLVTLTGTNSIVTTATVRVEPFT